MRLGLVPALGLSVGLTAPETLGQVLEEVLVTARKREENLQEVAVAVSVVTAQTIEDAGLVRLTDISQLVPNMTYQENISNKFTNITLRGISSSGGLGNDPGVGVYVDEVYVARESGFNADLLDIERVEVLKGPQGTLFGRNTAVGAINIATKKPADEFTGMVLADVGDYDYQRYGGYLNGPLTDNLAAKISGVYHERDGYLDNTYGGTVNTVDYYTFRGQALWAPMERLELLLIGDYRKDTSDGNNLVTRNQGDPVNKNYEVSIPDSGSEDVEAKGVALTANYELDNYLLTSITSGNKIDEKYQNDQDWSDLDALTGNDTRDNKQWSQELRISSTSDSKLQWVAGLYYFNQQFDATQEAINGPDTIYAAFGLTDLIGTGTPPSSIGLPDSVTIKADSVIKADSYAAYANIDYSLSEQWSVDAGIRYSKDEKKLDYTQTADPIAAAFGFLNLDIKDDIDDDQWTPTISLNWTPMDDLLTYAKYSKGYKAGGFNNSISSTGSAIAFDPEKLDAYELGLKSTWLDNTLRVNAAVFHMEYDDKQESAFVTGVGFVQTNAGEATSDGVELEVQYLLRDYWSIYGSVGYTDAQYDQYIIDEDENNNGNDLTRAPEWTANIGTQIEWQYTDYLHGMFRVDYSYQDESFTKANNDPFYKAEEQNIVNARLQISDAERTWQATLWGRNLTDDDSINTIDGPSTFFFDTYHYSLIAPRTWGVELQYNF
ncbi:MAG: TonB-dependent receptor [Halieaceae bacterium]|nr:TonB-dependent receptor [Halieaceae bacterium]